MLWNVGLSSVHLLELGVYRSLIEERLVLLEWVSKTTALQCYAEKDVDDFLCRKTLLSPVKMQVINLDN